MTAGRDPEHLAALLERAPGPLARRLDSVRAIASGLGVAVWWVGGGVRDLLRGAPTVDIDLVVEGPASAERLAGALADGLGGSLRRHERFLTSTLELADGAALDVAAARSETYDAPGALPRVEPAGLDQDLLRRDFSINAIALRIAPSPPELRDPTGGRPDLAAGLLRVLHAASFRDDPTRILRGLRFERRFGFRFDAATEALAREALAAGVLSAVSGERVRSDLAPLFETPDGLWPAFTRGAGLGLWLAIDAGLEGALPDPGRVADVAAEAATLAWTTPEPGVPSAWRLALLLLVESLPRSRRRSVAARLGRDARERALAIEGPERVARAGALLAHLPDPPAHAVARALADCGAEELAAVAAGSPAARRWVERDLAEFRPLRLRVRGADLIAAGLPPGPALRRALDRTLDARFDARIGVEEELDFALTAAREAQE